MSELGNVSVSACILAKNAMLSGVKTACCKKLNLSGSKPTKTGGLKIQKAPLSWGFLQ